MARPVTTSELFRCEERRGVFGVPSKAISTVLRWQIAATAVLAAAAGYLAGIHGALSAILGGGVSVVAGLVFVAVAGWRKVRSAEGVLLSALRAEGAKIGAIVILLWLVLSLYKHVVILAFFAAFAVTVIIFSLAFFVRET